MFNNPENNTPIKKQLNAAADITKRSAARAAAGTGKFLSELPGRIKSLYKGQKHKSSLKLRRTGRERIYRLKGYTTVAKINRKRHAERQQRFLRKFLFVFIAILIVILLFTIYNPFKDMSELKKILGIESVDDLTKTRYTIATTINETTESEFIINTDIASETSDDESIQD